MLKSRRVLDKQLHGIREMKRAMETNIVKISLRNKKCNKWRREKSKVADETEGAASLKWRRVGHNE